ncbi:mesothelin isoform X2 [Sciurus carolinensis]|uniref:mesothelin isoform X2 n=1 Tax=Sciurus carolinensis TaxID=30640 RepID=UPI001FB3E445|nr:mesothelin isoform X2 [Sciurus carolinensis]
MALPTTRRSLGTCGAPAHGRLLLLLLSLGWLQPLRSQVTETGQAEIQDPGLGTTSGLTSSSPPPPAGGLPGAPGPGPSGSSQGSSATQRTPLQASISGQAPVKVVSLRAGHSEGLGGHVGPAHHPGHPQDRACPQRQGTCPPGRKPHTVDENLIFYEEWELEACVDGALLDAQMALVNMLPFTYQQIHILKCRLDQGYPESLVQRLGYFFRYVSPEDIHKWNLTSLETVKALLSVSKGQRMDTQVTALIARYVLGGGQLDQDTMSSLADVRPAYLCFLSAEQLDSVPSRVMWTLRPQDLDSCGPRQLDILYSKARWTFRNMSQPEYLGKIQTFLGGAPVEDLRTLILQNMTMDVATFKRLRVEAVVGLTVSEVQRLLGTHVGDLKAEEENSPVRDWILQQRQEDLDTLGLQGGIPNGYLVLHLSSREAFSGVCPLRGPGLVLAASPALLLALTLS